MKTCVIVDGYRFSKEYIFHLNKKNIQCVHVQSTSFIIPDFSDASTYDPADYAENFIYDNRLDLLIDALIPFNPIAVIPAMESGVILSDEINNALHLKSNVYSLSKERRNKFHMIEALKNAGVAFMKYTNARNLEDAIAWVNKNTVYPVVIKPLESAGTDSVYICETEKSLANHFENIIQHNNCFGMKNQSVLVQELLKGTEYMVNSVSFQGEHYFTDIWCCHKRYIKDHGMIYDKEELLPFQGVIQDDIKRYLNGVLNALGFNYGAAHAEVMLTDRGPILIEVGARVGGNVNCNAHTACLGNNQLELNVDAYVDPTSFIKKTQAPYYLQKNMMTILLSTEQEGIIDSVPLFEKIKSFKTLYWYRLNVAVGDVLKPTRDLFSSPGKIILMHENSDLILQEYTLLMRAMTDAFVLKSEVM